MLKRDKGGQCGWWRREWGEGGDIEDKRRYEQRGKRQAEDVPGRASDALLGMGFIVGV